MQPFVQTNNLRFPTVQPRSAGACDRADYRYAIGAVTAYTGNYQGVAGDLGYDYGARLYSPWVFLMNEYQHIVFLPGQVFALVMLTGLAGIFLPRRRTAVAALLWVSRHHRSWCCRRRSTSTPTGTCCPRSRWPASPPR